MVKKVEELPHGVVEISEMLNKFLFFNPNGLMVFFNKDVPWVTDYMLYLIATAKTEGDDAGVRIQGGNLTQYADARIDAVMGIEKLIRQYGGLDMIRQKFEIYTALAPKDCKILKEVSQIGCFDFPNMTAVASLNRMNTHTLRRRIKKALLEVACLIYAKSDSRRWVIKI